MKVRKCLHRKVFLSCFFTFTLLYFHPSPLIAEDHFRLVITADMMGAINECDCPGGQPGGLARRKSIFDVVRVETPDAVFIDCGTLSINKMKYNEIDLTVELLDALDYNLINGSRDDFMITMGKPRFQTNKNENISGEMVTIKKYNLPFSYGLFSLVAFTITRDYEKNINPFQYNLAMMDGKIKVTPISSGWITPDTYSWDFSITQTGISIIVSGLVESDNREFPSIPSGEKESNYPLDLVIFSGGGYVDASVETFSISRTDSGGSVKAKKILVARAGIYGEYVLVIDIWTEDGNEISRFEWEAIPTEVYPPDSTFQAKIDRIYEGRVDSRDK